jgi:hypothetical protein
MKLRPSGLRVSFANLQLVIPSNANNLLLALTSIAPETVPRLT